MLARVAGRSEGMLFALFGMTVVCVLGLFVLPRALVPEVTPPLVLERESAQAVIEQDRAAQSGRVVSPAAIALDRLFLEYGAAEDQRVGSEPILRRRQRLAQSYRRLLAESGETAALALRARAVERFEAALALRLPKDEAKRVLGLFPEAAARYGAIRDGVPVAPKLVLRALYKVRWNLAMELAPDYALSKPEHRAYYGWLALHAKNLPLVTRTTSLAQYARAGGAHVAEARGVLAFLEQDYETAVSTLTQAYRESPSLRVRNWLRGARVARQAASEAL